MTRKPLVGLRDLADYVKRGIWEAPPDVTRESH